jgi:hypothetical protein
MKFNEFLSRHRLFINFLILGILAFVAYVTTDALMLTFILIGPPLYAAGFLKKALSPLLFGLLGGENPHQSYWQDWQLNFFFVLPVTLLYFGLIGFQFNQLLNDKGWFHRLTFLVMLGFICFLHYITWNDLGKYYAAVY